jgi:ppGpp synthetase/RelA/SpoT-type nucleotidyltranferase
MSKLTKNKFSNHQLRKLGKMLKLDDFEYSVIEDLEEYRLTFKGPSKEVYNTMIHLAKEVSPNPISTYRIKRIDTIISKLKRLKNRQLDKIWDIAGCRCILKTDKQIGELKKLIGQKFTIIKENNYYETSKKSGYRSLHLYVAPNNSPNKRVEIQLRKEEDHNWATLVEILDQVYQVNIKEGMIAKENFKLQKELEQFLKLLVKVDSLGLKDKRALLTIAVRYDIFNRLRNIFIENYVHVRKQYASFAKSHSSYYLIEVDTRDNKPMIHRYPNFDEAENAYFSKYGVDGTKNIVMVNISSTKLEDLEQAYSNYILTMHNFINDYFDIIGDVMASALEKGIYVLFRNTYKVFISSALVLGSDYDQELMEIDNLPKDEFDKYKIRYWKRDFKKKFGDRRKLIQKINKRLQDGFNDDLDFEWIYKRTVRKTCKANGLKTIEYWRKKR